METLSESEERWGHDDPNFTLIYQPLFTLYNPNLPVVGWIPRNFKNFILKPKLSFLMNNHKNDNCSGFPGFDELILYMIFAIFWNFHSDNDYSHENFKNGANS